MTIRNRCLSFLLLLAVMASLALPARAAGTMAFTDLTEKHWAYPYVKDLYDAQVVAGITSTTFEPAGKVTLGQALKLILLAAGYEEQTPTTNHWASGYYHLANKNLFLGSASHLTLDQTINRLQVAQIAAAALGCQRLEHTLSPFKDTVDLKVLALYDNGIMNGIQEGDRLLFKPEASITRAEISAVVWRMLEWRKAQGDPSAQEVPEALKPVVEETQAPAPAPEEPVVQPATPATPTVDPVPAVEDPAKVQPVASEEPETARSPDGYFTWREKTVPIWNEIPRNPYDADAFSYDENGFLIYDDARYTCRVGVDVSKYQGTVDWSAVKESGVDFAILRLGYRGYKNGKLVMDPAFYTNLQGCLDNDIEVGVYFFSQALNYDEGVEEAKYVISALRNYNITYPVVFDWEPYDASVNARTKNITDEQLTQAALGFLETVDNAGWKAMLYGNLTYFYRHFDMSQVGTYPLWLALYSKTYSFYYACDIWQYSSTGSLPGVKGEVDLNIQFIPRS